MHFIQDYRKFFDRSLKTNLAIPKKLIQKNFFGKNSQIFSVLVENTFDNPAGKASMTVQKNWQNEKSFWGELLSQKQFSVHAEYSLDNYAEKLLLQMQN